MKIKLIALIFLTAIFSSSSDAYAQQMECIYKNVKDLKKLDNDFKEFFIQSQDEATIKVCTKINDKNNIYFLTSRILERNDVCFYTERLIIKKNIQDKITWTFDSSSETVLPYSQYRMKSRNQSCANYSESDYTLTTGVSLGLFKSIDNFFNHVKSSNKNFNQVMSVFFKSNTTPAIWKEFEKDMLSDQSKLTHVSFMSSVGFAEYEHLPIYLISIAGRERSWSILLDWYEGQFNIISIGIAK